MGPFFAGRSASLVFLACKKRLAGHTTNATAEQHRQNGRKIIDARKPGHTSQVDKIYAPSSEKSVISTGFILPSSSVVSIRVLCAPVITFGHWYLEK
jgi:hypothetical protein